MQRGGFGLPPTVCSYWIIKQKKMIRDEKEGQKVLKKVEKKKEIKQWRRLHKVFARRKEEVEEQNEVLEESLALLIELASLLN